VGAAGIGAVKPWGALALRWWGRPSLLMWLLLLLLGAGSAFGQLISWPRYVVRLSGGAQPGASYAYWYYGDVRWVFTRTNDGVVYGGRDGGGTSHATASWVNLGGGVYEATFAVRFGVYGSAWVVGGVDMADGGYLWLPIICGGVPTNVVVPLGGWSVSGWANNSADGFYTAGVIERGCSSATNWFTTNRVSGFSSGVVRMRMTNAFSGSNLVGVVQTYEVGGVKVRELMSSNGVVYTNYDIRRDLVGGGITASEVPYVLGGLVAGAGGGGGGGTGGVVNVDVMLTGSFTAAIDWTQGVAYARSELPGGTNWGWVEGAARAVAVGSEDRPGPPGVSGWSGAPDLAVQIRPGVVMNVGAGLGDWMARIGGVVRNILALLVLVWFGWWVSQQVHEDLRIIWIAPQGRTAGQTVMGTGMQAASAVAISSVVIGVIGALAAVAWQWVLQWLGVFSGGGGGLGFGLSWLLYLPGALRLVLDIGPWQTIISCLMLVPGVMAARMWLVAVGSSMVRLLTGL